MGSRAALEVRAHDVPFMVEHGQRVCKLTFSRMLEPPKSAYGTAVASHYQHQEDSLSKHFVLPDWLQPGPPPAHQDDQPRLFSEN